MKCPKCHYLSFEPEARCRNCGHDLSLDEPAGGDPLADFFLDRDESEAAPGRTRRTVDPMGGVATLTPPVVARSAVTTELPLFVRDMVEGDTEVNDNEDDDEDEDERPLVQMPARPRKPLAVRRPTPDPSRLRAAYPASTEPDLLDVADLVGAADIGEPGEMAAAAEPVMWQRAEAAAAMPRAAAGVSALARLAAAAIDAAVLGAVAATTVAFTLRLVDLPAAEVLALPAVPMLAFFVMLGLGYELMFTAANGQTIGKMAMGLRVVPDEADSREDRVSLRQAALRAVSMLPLGAGVLAVLGGHRLAVHDRVAHTRVVRA